VFGRWPLTSRVLVRVGLVTLLFVVVQQTLMLDLRVGGVHPDIMILLPIVAGLVGGPSRGAWMGFATGLVADLFLPTPFGLSALVATMLGYAVGVATLALDRTAVWLPVVAALAGSALYELVYGVLGSVLGQPQMLHVDLVRVIAVVSITNAVLAIPAMGLVTWAVPAASTEGVPTSPLSSGVAR